jgi:hypothetical protein
MNRTSSPVWRIKYILEETCDGARFDLYMRENLVSTHTSPDGALARIPVKERGFVIHELPVE